MLDSSVSQFKTYKISVITRDGMYCFYMPEWYCKPRILESLVYYLHSFNDDGFVNIVKCSRYPSMVILCKKHKEYTIYTLHDVTLPNGISFTVPVFK